MRWTSSCVCLVGTALLLVNSAEAASTFEFVFESTPAVGSAGSNVAVNLVLRETFDGNGSELLDSTDGPGLFSFSTAIAMNLSTTLSPAVFSSITLNPAFDPLLSDSTIGPMGIMAELNGAIMLGGSPLTNGPATGAPNTLDVHLATLNFTASPDVGNVTSFDSAIHSNSAFLPTLDGNGSEIPITYGAAGDVVSIPEPATLGMLSGGLLLAALPRRRRR